MVDASLQHLQASVNAGWIDYRSLELDPRFDAVASDSRFLEIIEQVKGHVGKLISDRNRMELEHKEK